MTGGAEFQKDGNGSTAIFHHEGHEEHEGESMNVNGFLGSIFFMTFMAFMVERCPLPVAFARSSSHAR